MLLEARNVSKTFGSFRAVDGIDFEIAAGEMIGLIGPNGAGKSTFFNCLSGDSVPSAGTIIFAGVDVTRAPPEEHARLGMARTHQIPETFEHMSVLENVMVGAFLRYPRRRDAERAARRVVELIDIGEHADRRAGSLSTSGRKRLEIARALATEPSLLLLDEALAGLTPAETRAAMALVRRVHEMGVTLVIVEHVMEVILSLAQRVLVFNHGAMVTAGKPIDVVNNPLVIEAYLGRGRLRPEEGKRT